MQSNLTVDNQVPAIIKLKQKQLKEQKPITASARVAVPNSESESENQEKVQKSFRPMDPRFLKTADYTGSAFINSYKFITELRKKELQSLEQQYNSSSDQKLKKNIMQIKQKIVQAEARNFDSKVKRDLRKAEREAIQDGKQIYHMSSRDTRDAVKAARFVEKTKNGGAHFIEKRYQRKDAIENRNIESRKK